MDPSLSEAEERLLAALPSDGAFATLADAAKLAGFAQEVQALQAAGAPGRAGLVEVDEQPTRLVRLSDEGLRHQERGLPERRALRAILAAGGRLELSQLAPRAGLEGDEAKVAVGWLRRKKWAETEKADGATMLRASADAPAGPDEQALAALGAQWSEHTADTGLGALAQRGGVLETMERVERRLRLTAEGRTVATAVRKARASGARPGPASGPSVQKIEVGQVTPELVAAWPAMTEQQRSAIRLRPYDVALGVAPQPVAKAHPLQAIIEEIRDIFLQMGFAEIGGDYVESAFWNMDALFIPQDHPARDMQDTFYLREPAALNVPAGPFAAVGAAHQTGAGTGSTGWGGTFDRAQSAKALLRTHTTVTTIRHLAANPAVPCKVFGIGRVFRNEAMDATHLPEFHQVEGIIMEPCATFGTLMGVLQEFYTRMGFPEVRFRPSYYPYTEPSLDVAVKWNDKWLELGGAGMFRPEVTAPIGVKMPVLAWGLGLERLAMLRLGLKDIRQLYLSDLQWLKDTPVV